MNKNNKKKTKKTKTKIQKQKQKLLLSPEQKRGLELRTFEDFLDVQLRKDFDVAAKQPQRRSLLTKFHDRPFGQAEQGRVNGASGLREQSEQLDRACADLKAKNAWLTLKVERRDAEAALELDLLLHSVKQRTRYVHGLENRKQLLQVALKTMKEEGLRSLARLRREGDQREKADSRAKEEK